MDDRFVLPQKINYGFNEALSRPCWSLEWNYPMAIVSSGALIDALRQYGLLAPDKLSQLPHLAHGRCADARSFAKLLGQQGWLTIYQINQLLAGNAKNLVFGPYHVLDSLGKGGLSQVFKARHSTQKFLVALKVIRPEALASSEGKNQFLHEMEAMARLDHPNIVQFCDVDQSEDTFYFAMEYVEGTDLGKYLSLSGPLPVPEACEYIYQAALGLQHAYERNLVHRDIKPVNLYLTHVPIPKKAPSSLTGKATKTVKQPLIKILDWGLADLRAPKGQTQAQLMENIARGIIGTADYLSPEQARSAHSVDTRSDLYSLGCTFYFLLTRQAPFPSGSLMQKLIQHQQGEPEPVDSFRNDVPTGVRAILQRMMAKKPEDRFQTPAAVALALLPFIRGNPQIYSLDREQLARLRGVPFNPLNDDTPLPRALGGKPDTSTPRLPKAGPARSPDAHADTSCPS
jgi:serine/threonine protein kinase